MAAVSGQGGSLRSCSSRDGFVAADGRRAVTAGVASDRLPKFVPIELRILP